ncbi:MAG: glycosyltransferase [Verrucomicrobiota bacterium]
MERPKISVVIPVYNASRYLSAAVRSILVQTCSDFELIAVDDGSTDQSKAILEGLAAADPRIRIVSRPNTGIVGALNDGIAVARGEFIARMDADDLAVPTRFAAQCEYLENHPECVALGTDILYTDPEGAPLIRHQPALQHDEIVNQLVDGNGGALIHPTVFFRRAALEQVGGYRQQFNWIEDLDLYLRLSEIGKLANLPTVFLHYRQHLKSVNRTQGTREALRQQIVNPYRLKRGLGDLKSTPSPTDALRTPADWRRHWAYDAARGGYHASARKNAWRAFLKRPFDRSNQRCLRYSYTVGAVPQASLPSLG